MPCTSWPWQFNSPEPPTKRRQKLSKPERSCLSSSVPVLSTMVWQEPWTARSALDGATGDVASGGFDALREHAAETQSASRAARGNERRTGQILQRPKFY